MGLLRNLLFDNLGLKFVALLLAFMAYLHVYTERPATMTVSFPLEMVDLSDSLSLSGTPPPAVSAELRGTGKSLIRLRLTEPRIKVSLSGARPGRFERHLTVDDLPLIPSDRLEVTHIAGPTSVELDVDRKIERQVPVAPRVEADLPAGVTIVGSPTADPRHVLVRGPAGVVSRLDSLRLQVMRVDARHDTVRARFEPDQIPAWCTVEPPVVQVTVVLAGAAP